MALCIRPVIAHESLTRGGKWTRSKYSRADRTRPPGARHELADRRPAHYLQHVRRTPFLTGPPYPCYVLGTDRDCDNPLYTVNWKATVTPSGQGTLKCHYKHDWALNCEDYGNCAPD